MTRKRKKKLTAKRPEVEKEYWEDIEIIDPVTGKKTIQKVKITRYKAGPQIVESSDEDDIIESMEQAKTHGWDWTDDD